MKEHIDFSTIREELNQYHVETGQTLKFKMILTDIFVESDNRDSKAFNLGVQEFSVVISDNEIDTSTFEYSSKEQITEKDQIKELGFKPMKEVINIYETQKNFIMISSSISKIYLTNKKDKTNNPILRYENISKIDTIEKIQIR